MDFDDMTAAEIFALIEQAQSALYTAQQSEAADEAAKRAQIGQATQGVTDLLGPVDASPGIESIRAVRAFDAADVADGKPRGTTMADNPAIALSLAFEGLEILASLVRDIATVTGREP